MTLPDNNQPFHKDQSRLSNYEVGEKASEAKGLLENSVLQGALIEIYSKASGMLLESDTGSLTALAQHAMMKATVELQKQLEQYISDDKMRQKYNKEDK